MDLNWLPIPGSAGCQVKISPVDSPEYAADIDTIPNQSSYSIPGSSLEFQTFYTAQVRCGCENDSLVYGAWSYPINFYSGAIGQNQPCELPYPVVHGLTHTPEEDGSGITLKWNGIPESKGCRIEYQSDEGPFEAVFVQGESLSEFTLDESQLVQFSQYQWRVKCGCKWDPLIAGEWSSTSSFITGPIGSLDGFPPKSRFNVYPIAPVVGDQVEFRNRSLYEPETFLWNFGDGNTSEEENPSHAYDTPGIYTVSLTVSNELGENTKVKEEHVQVFESSCPSVAMDIDGNTYDVVQMGASCWFKENLRVTKFNNGDEIENIVPANDWIQTTLPAYAYYLNDPTDAEEYGALYNGYVVLDDRNVCPTGWHVPTESEWQELEMLIGMPEVYLDFTSSSRGGNQNIGGQLKTDDLWVPFNLGAVDAYGFSVKPAGYRFFFISDFTGRATLAKFFVKNDLSEFPLLYTREFLYLSRAVPKNTGQVNQGTSIRCIMD